MIFSPDGLMRYNNGIFAIVDDMPLLSQWIKKSDKSKLVGFFGGDGEDRTLDLLNAIQALSQLSYAPISEVISNSE